MPDADDLTDRATDAAVRPATSPIELIGHTIANSYHVERRLGAGGMGVVYLARHLRLGYHVALKCIHPGLTPDPATTRRFLQEARAAAQIRHDNVVQVVDAGQLADGFPYIVMEYLEGESLSVLVEREGPLPWRRVAFIMAQVAGALAAAHDVGILHRDIKPANCLRVLCAGDADIIKVLDFGLAKLAHELRNQSESMTSTGVIMGTPGYIAPEVYRGFRADARSDLYALGVLSYRLLEDELPPFRMPDTALTRAPASLRAVILRCLSHDPEDRYASAAQVEAALLDLLRVATDGPTATAVETPLTTIAGRTQSAPLPRPLAGITTPTSIRTRRWVWWAAVAALSTGAWLVFMFAAKREDTTATPARAPVASATESPVGSLYLELSPPEAIVTIDGVEVPGTGSPRSVGALSAGAHNATHRLRVNSDAFYLPREESVTITAGQTRSLAIALQFRDVTVSVHTSPDDAIIKLVEGNGMPTVVARGGEAFKIRRLPRVLYKLIGERDGYEPNEVPVDFSGDQTDRFNMLLRPVPSRTSVIVEPLLPAPIGPKNVELKLGSGPGLPPATVWIDGRLQAKPTPISVMVTPGSHTVKWEYPDGKTTTKKIDPSENTSVVIKGTL